MRKAVTWNALAGSIKGELYTDDLYQALYATDASIYKETPLGVVYPRDEKDLVQIVKFAAKEAISLIPRTAGTSLAGQCVGSGLVVDVSRHMNRVLSLDVEKRQVRVQPGVIRDELNAFLQPHGLHFGPDTSTVNRCMIGGMVGNNSCGTSSIVYGTTRDHVLSIRSVLSDGSIEEFAGLNETEWKLKCEGKDLASAIYRHMDQLLSDPEIRSEIEKQYPDKKINRRNTGYALDILSGMNPYTAGGALFNMCSLLCGSEGTLAISSEILLDLDPLPPAHHLLVCAHYSSIYDCMLATQRAMRHRPQACELMDKIILDCTRAHKEFIKNRWFVQGDPAALLIVELRRDDREELDKACQKLMEDLRTNTAAFALVRIEAKDSKKVWDLRKAGLGLMSNIPGEAKPVACIEDTAVSIDLLADYIAEVVQMMDRYGQSPVYYAHAGAGEIHLRPVLNLKDPKGRQDLYDISRDSALLVKKYGGSLSGEHGDGRVRAPFIPLVMGEKLCDTFREVKKIWDPQGIFNPGKIVDTEPMNESLRYTSGQKNAKIESLFDFEGDGGFLGTVEKCNGSGDCRKLPFSGGTMCPSYHATRNEKDTTRGRANALREFLSRDQRNLRFGHPELKEVMDLCIACKGCSSECPSNVDMARIKSEFLYQYQREKGFSLKNRLQAFNYSLLKMAALWPSLSNVLFRMTLISAVLKKWMGMSPRRSIPLLSGQSLRSWYRRNYKVPSVEKTKGKLVLFADEFTEHLDTSIGIKAIQLLSGIGYHVIMLEHRESGRAMISKGFLKSARRMAEENVRRLQDTVGEDCPLVGIEPSAILSFRDEYPALVSDHLKKSVSEMSRHCYTIEEFISREIDKGRIDSSSFEALKSKVLLHGHCHQKALSSLDHSVKMLSLIPDLHVEIIPSGCCGMAGSFGYDAEHYNVSMQIGELVLFPAVRKEKEETIVVAAGTSCRHQILDGTGRRAVHPVGVLHMQLRKSS